jgi:hypothetical protein
VSYPTRTDVDDAVVREIRDMLPEKRFALLFQVVEKFRVARFAELAIAQGKFDRKVAELFGDAVRVTQLAPRLTLKPANEPEEAERR